MFSNKKATDYIDQQKFRLDLRHEMVRRSSRTAILLALFKKYRSLTTYELNQIGTGCSSRLNELRKEGHVIEAEYIKPGQWKYTYIAHRALKVL